MKLTTDPRQPQLAILEYTDDEALELGHQIAHDDSKIIRYMNLSKFYSIITDESIMFSRMDQYNDKYEGLAIVNSTDTSIEFFRKQSVVNCWNHFTKESYALWRIYLSKEETGVAIVSTVGDFKQSIKDLEVKNNIEALTVKYLPHNKVYKGITNQLLASRKKNFYEYEEEIRFNYSNPEYRETEHPERIPIKLNPFILIKQIILSPYMPTWIENSFKHILGKYGLQDIEVRHSEIKENL